MQFIDLALDCIPNLVDEYLEVLFGGRPGLKGTNDYSGFAAGEVRLINPAMMTEKVKQASLHCKSQRKVLVVRGITAFE